MKNAGAEWVLTCNKWVQQIIILFNPAIDALFIMAENETEFVARIPGSMRQNVCELKRDIDAPENACKFIACQGLEGQENGCETTSIN